MAREAICRQPGSPRCADGVFGGPFVLGDASHDRSGLNSAARVEGPVCDALHISEGGEQDISTGVSLVLRNRSPSAVERRVAAIVVDAINLKRGIVAVADTPVFKCLEVEPLPANRNAAPAVGVERVVPLVCAALNHPVPYAIELRPRSMCAVTVSRNGASDQIGPGAAAGHGVPQKLVLAHHSLCPTVADAAEKVDVVAASCGDSSLSDRSRKDRPKAELLPDGDALHRSMIFRIRAEGS